MNFRRTRVVVSAMVGSMVKAGAQGRSHVMDFVDVVPDLARQAHTLSLLYVLVGSRNYQDAVSNMERSEYLSR